MNYSRKPVPLGGITAVIMDANYNKKINLFEII